MASSLVGTGALPDRISIFRAARGLRHCAILPCAIARVWAPPCNLKASNRWISSRFSEHSLEELLRRGERTPSARIKPNLSLYANADFEFELGHTDGGKRQSLRGALGLRYSS